MTAYRSRSRRPFGSGRARRALYGRYGPSYALPIAATVGRGFSSALPQPTQRSLRQPPGRSS